MPAGYLTSHKFSGDTCELSLLRNGEEIKETVTLMHPEPLVPHHLSGRDPSYFILAGVVFTSVTEPYLLSEYGCDYHREAPVKLLDKLLHGHKETRDEEIVIVSQILASDATLGYEDGYNSQVISFNGTPVENLRHLCTMVLACNDRFMTLELEYNELLVLDTQLARSMTKEVLDRHGIPSMASKDLQDLVQHI